MFHQPRSFQASALVRWPIDLARQVDAVCPGQLAAPQRAWMAAFVERMGELRPFEDRETLQEIAADMWIDVGGHDPMIAAEMEHEATFGLD